MTVTQEPDSVGHVLALADEVFEELLAQAAVTQDAVRGPAAVLRGQAALAVGVVDASVRFVTASLRPPVAAPIAMTVRPGEVAAGQVWVHAAGVEAADVRLTISPLASAVGANGLANQALPVLAADVGDIVHQTDPPGWCAPLWVQVPAGTPAGRYTGAVTTMGSPASSIEVTLDVEA